MEKRKGGLLSGLVAALTGGQQARPRQYWSMPVAGTYYCKENLEQLAKKVPLYSMPPDMLEERGLLDRRIWEYKFRPSVIDLQPEPTNEHDRHAVRVLADGLFIGYVPAENSARVSELIRKKKVRSVSCRFGGGRWIQARKSSTGRYSISEGQTDYTVELKIEL